MEIETLSEILTQKRQQLIEYREYPTHCKRLKLQIEKLENKIAGARDMEIKDVYKKYRKDGLSDKEAIRKICKEFKLSKTDVQFILNI